MVVSQKLLRTLLISVMVMAIFLVAACSNNQSDADNGNAEEKVVNIMGWAGYLPQNVINQFKDETGITINFQDITSNEEILAKLEVGNHGYDIVMPSINYVEVLIQQERLEEINKDNIPNLKLISDELYDFDFDPERKYFVPAYWGGEIIAVNEDLVDKDIKGFQDLFDPVFENNLVAIDDPRVMLGTMLHILGYSVNSTNEQEIKEAEELLKKLTPNIKSYSGSEAEKLLAGGEVVAGIVYSGKVSMARKENPSIKAVIPEEGIATMWQDNFVIPKGAPHKENAEKLIDFLLRPEINKEIMLEQPYPGAVEEAIKLLPNDLREEMEVIPTEEIKPEAFIMDVGEALQYYDRAWTSVKQ